jgi:hypothetical protein
MLEIRRGYPYPVSMNEMKTYTVPGMRCAHCVAAVSNGAGYEADP